MTPQELVTKLESNVGPTIIAVVTSNRDRKIAHKWIAGEEVPTPEELEKLRFLDEIFDRVVAAEGREVALTWLCAAGVDEGDKPRFMRIRDGNLESVKISAQRLINGTYGF